MANMLEWLINHYCKQEGLGWPPKESTYKDSKSALKTHPCLARIAEHEQKAGRTNGAPNDI